MGGGGTDGVLVESTGTGTGKSQLVKSGTSFCNILDHGSLVAAPLLIEVDNTWVVVLALLSIVAFLQRRVVNIGLSIRDPICKECLYKCWLSLVLATTN